MNDRAITTELPASPASDSGTAAGRGIRTLAKRIGCTEGQAYTLAIGLLVAVVTAAIGVPPALRDRPVERVAAPRAPAEIASPPRTVTGIEPSPPPTPAPVAAPPPAQRFRATEPRPASPPPTPAPTPAPTFADGGPFGSVEVFAHVRRPGSPDGIAVSPRGDVWVSTNNTDEATPAVLHYSLRGSLLRRIEVPRAAPAAAGLTGLALDDGGALYALDAAGARVVRIPSGGVEPAEFARIPDLPPCVLVLTQGPCEPGAEDHAPFPRAAALGSGSALFVSDAGQATIWRVPPGGGDAEIWHQSADYLQPGPAGLQFDAAGHLVFAVTTTAPAMQGAIYLLEVRPDGRPGERTRLAALASDEDPVGIALSAAGRVHTTLGGSDEILVLRPDGTEHARISPEGEPAFDNPVGVAFRGRSLLVTNADGDDPAKWMVLRVSVEEAALR